jgi:hypothetical protein
MQSVGLNVNQSAFGDEEQVRKLSFLVWRLNLSRKRKGIDGRSLRCSNRVRERERAFSGRVQMQMGKGYHWGRREVKEIPPSLMVRK